MKKKSKAVQVEKRTQAKQIVVRVSEKMTPQIRHIAIKYRCANAAALDYLFDSLIDPATPLPIEVVRVTKISELMSQNKRLSDALREALALKSADKD